MSQVVFTAISTASLGTMLKGYGILACIGEKDRQAEFWWDEAGHLVCRAKFEPVPAEAENNKASDPCLKLIEVELRRWAGLCKNVRPASIIWNDKKLRKERFVQHDKLKELSDRLSEDEALVVASISADLKLVHPLLAGFGKYGARPEANYLVIASKLPAGSVALPTAVFGTETQLKTVDLQGGGAFFPNAIKRYATGINWVHEKDAPVTYWDFALAVRGALLLRGAARRFRGSRRSYPSFPFVFRGSPVTAGGQVFITDEVHLPTWSADRPRTLPELELQIRQLQARVGGGELASTAAEFRRAVQGRGVAGGFDRFHRFVLERRKPGQPRPAVQAIARGVTVVGEGATELRALLARIDEIGWLDQLEQPTVRNDRRDERLLLAAREIHDAVHACADHPTAEQHVAILSALWRANGLLLDRVARARNGGEATTIHALPLPPLGAAWWERVLGRLDFFASPEARIARALASIGWNGWDVQKRRWAPGSPWPLATQLLSVEYTPSSQARCRVPEQKVADRVAWRGFHPERDFAELLRRRWLDALGRDNDDRLPFVATRTAPLADVLDLLRGQLNLTEIQRLCSALLVLDWSRIGAEKEPHPKARTPIPAVYAVLRLWLDAGINPPRDRRASWDGAIAQAVVHGDSASVRSACRLAISRLRVTGLPERSPSEERRGGKAVATPELRCAANEPKLMALAVLVPIDRHDTYRLADRLRVPTNEEAAYA